MEVIRLTQDAVNREIIRAVLFLRNFADNHKREIKTARMNWCAPPSSSNWSTPIVYTLSVKHAIKHTPITRRDQIKYFMFNTFLLKNHASLFHKFYIIVLLWWFTLPFIVCEFQNQSIFFFIFLSMLWLHTCRRSHSVTKYNCHTFFCVLILVNM